MNFLPLLSGGLMSDSSRLKWSNRQLSEALPPPTHTFCGCGLRAGAGGWLWKILVTRSNMGVESWEVKAISLKCVHQLTFSRQHLSSQSTGVALPRELECVCAGGGGHKLLGSCWIRMGTKLPPTSTLNYFPKVAAGPWPDRPRPRAAAGGTQITYRTWHVHHKSSQIGCSA